MTRLLMEPEQSLTCLTRPTRKRPVHRQTIIENGHQLLSDTTIGNGYQMLIDMSSLTVRQLRVMTQKSGITFYTDQTSPVIEACHKTVTLKTLRQNQNATM